MPVYFVDADAIRPPLITIRGPLARHLARSLRMQPGERCRFIGPHRRYLGELTTVTPSTVIATIVREEAAPPRLRPVTVGQAILKGHRMDWALQKSAELGATRIIPLVTDRTIVRPRRERITAQLRRWQSILHEAAQQSGRSDEPELAAPCNLRECLNATPPSTVRLILSEAESDERLSRLVAALPPDQPILLLVGPEGGFGPDELAEAVAHGARPVSLGPLILRSETAALAALALVHNCPVPSSSDARHTGDGQIA
jgi:16S rRNA (uracil1498-N3)-methyltransferase